ncbi:mechanosensitive ion channel family protein [uncultured Methanomethylovorans sp.]|uniref:mechanosensitive ion channel family protein n=1 Tax=uncultured Methanomethylovorans sp. TaxID=183759 RepID=UPI002AA83C4A|nr:mechanosensitive ion channel family protein [uncultured Methanomethylovorans sp.]
MNDTVSLYLNNVLGTPAGSVESRIAMAIFIFLSSIIIAAIIDFLFKNVFMYYASKTKFEFDDLIIAALRKPLYLTVIITGTIFSLHYTDLSRNYTYTLDGLGLTSLFIIWIVALLRINKILFENVFPHITSKTDTQLDDELLPLFKGIMNIVIVFVGILAILNLIWGINVTPLFASAGIAGIAVAFAAQDSIAQLFGGISIYFDQPFKRGDRIELESGEIGIVQEVGIRTTRIMNLYNNMIIIPNSIIANSKIINYTSPQSIMVVKMTMGVAYGSDVEKVRDVLYAIIRDIDLVLDDPVAAVRLENYGDSSLDFALYMWIKNPADKIKLIDMVNSSISEEFEKEGIEIPFPTRTLFIKNEEENAPK